MTVRASFGNRGQPSEDSQSTSEEVMPETVVVTRNIDDIRAAQNKPRFVESVQSIVKRDGFFAWIITWAVLVILALIVISFFSSTIAKMLLYLAVIAGIYLLYRRSVVVANGPARAVPEGSVIPDRGFAKMIYWVYKFYGRPDKVPAVSKAQNEEMLRERLIAEDAAKTFSEAKAAQLLIDQEKAAWDRIRHIFNLGVHPTIVVLAQKGGASKTYCSVTIGNMLADNLKCVVGLLPGSTSTQTVTAGRISGVKEVTAGLRQLYDMFNGRALNEGLTIDYQTIHKYIAKTPSGLSVLAEDGQGKWISNFSSEKWKVLFKPFRANVDVAIVDTGNEDALKRTVTTEAVSEADVVLVSGNILAEQTLDMVGSTIGNYHALGSFGDLLKNAVCVFNAIDPYCDKQELLGYINTGLVEANADPAQFKSLVVHGIRMDQYLRETSRDVDYKNMNGLTQIDYLAVILSIFEKAARHQGVELPERDAVLDNFGIVISSPA